MNTAVPAIVIVLAVGGLIAAGIFFGSIPELQVREVLGAPPPAEQKIKVHGILHEIQQGHRPLRFTIRDKKDASLTLRVDADALRPDIFEAGKDIAIEGYFHSGQHRLEGTKIYTKCPSKYEESKEEGAP